ncbi:peptidase S8/S53 domain-containing protein [Boletus reticuloceps]|uniref:tripeptidyl-peptidase II n=1 Tax=Boletus reticuloceps TaxID=495285 RepID=A0A8I3AGX1_9AGAM|nr:peptidase S8/S53 domain-containing protein [Boletus reticuloceps]
MRCLSIFLIAASLGLLSSAEPFRSPYNIHEKRTCIPQGWSLTRRCNPISSIPLRFALKQKNIEEIGNYLYDMSHPNSPNYGKHWTAGDVARTFAPTDETVGVVRSWLITSGIGEERIALGRAKAWIQVNVTVEEAEELMNTEYNVYTHLSGKVHVACEVYYLPEHVQPHVDFITPSVHFDAKLTRRSSGESASSARGIGRLGFVSDLETAGAVSSIHGLEHCDTSITPICLRTLYDLFYNPVATDKNSFGIVEYTPNTYVQSDLQMFARNFSTDLIGKEPYLVSIDGGYAPTTNGTIELDIESDLDLEYGMSLVTGNQTVTLYQVGDAVNGASMNNFLDAIDGSYCTLDGGDDPLQDIVYPDILPGGYMGPEACGTVEPTYVISTSYSYNEADLGPFYAERQCAEYAKLGLMGITVLYSSGDNGVAGNSDLCLISNHTQSHDGYIFNPTFPGTCPYVTSVGATMVKPNATVFDPEVAMMGRIYSGGGFSNYFGMPEYQKKAVDHYLTKYRPDYPSTIWNSTGMSRGYPDISANGANYVVALDGGFRHISGTSCSSPVIGAILTMINDARLAIGKGPIGFVNPTIYSPEFADAFNDITEGNNPGCGTAGYNATDGWDPLTGLGTPKFPKLLALWLLLP